MTVRRPACEEVIGGRECGRPADWLVGLPELGFYPACSQHSAAWAPECRAPLDTETPIQRAIVSVLTAYQEATLILDANERGVLRDVIAARLARDYLTERGDLLLGDDREREVA
jgi:hypothetical protein